MSDMQELADAIMADWGEPAVYRADGEDPGLPVTVRRKPCQLALDERTRMYLVEISVRATEVPKPDYGDTFEMDGEIWTLRGLPDGDTEIMSHARGVLWQLILTRDARPTLRGGIA